MYFDFEFFGHTISQYGRKYVVKTRRHFGHKPVRVNASLRSLDAMTHKMARYHIIVWGK